MKLKNRVKRVVDFVQGIFQRLFNWFEKKRLADWFEKISAAFAVGAVLSETNAAVSVVLSVICLVFSQALAKRS